MASGPPAIALIVARDTYARQPSGPGLVFVLTLSTHLRITRCTVQSMEVVLSSTLTPTRGFHTSSTTRVNIRGSLRHSCTLHLYFDLPAQLFADPYELDHRRGSYAFEYFSAGNLEAPVFAPGAGGPSGLLLDVTVPEGEDNDILSIEVPLHARYGVPKRDGELTDEVVLPPPEAFWACTRERLGGEIDSGGAPQIPVPGSELTDTFGLYTAHPQNTC